MSTTADLDAIQVDPDVDAEAEEQETPPKKAPATSYFGVREDP